MSLSQDPGEGTGFTGTTMLLVPTSSREVEIGCSRRVVRCTWRGKLSTTMASSARCEISILGAVVVRNGPTLHYAASSVGDCQQENSSFKSHFLQVHLFQTKIFEMHFRFLFCIWVRVDCRPTSQQIYKRTSSNLIRKGTGCDEYVEDQLNVASKNFAKYLFDDTDGKRYL